MRNKGADQSEIDKCEQLRDQKNQEINMTELDRDGYFKPDKIRWTVIKGLPCEYSSFATVYSEKHGQDKITDVTEQVLRDKVKKIRLDEKLTEEE